MSLSVSCHHDLNIVFNNSLNMKLIIKFVRVMRLECKRLSIRVVGNCDGLFTLIHPLLPPSLLAGLNTFFSELRIHTQHYTLYLLGDSKLMPQSSGFVSWVKRNVNQNLTGGKFLLVLYMIFTINLIFLKRCEQIQQQFG